MDQIYMGLWGVIILFAMMLMLSPGGAIRMRKLFGQRGEVGDGEDGGEGGDAGDEGDGDGGKDGGDEDDISGLISIEDYLDVPEKPPEGEDGGDGDDGKDKDKAPAKKAAAPDPDAYEELVRKNKDLNRALHEERQKAKRSGKADGDDEPLTDDQILGLMTEYKDDPKTLLNVIKYQAQQAAKKEAVKAISDGDMQKLVVEAQQFISSRFPAMEEDGSEMRAAVEKTKDRLGIKDHPLGDMLGLGVESLKAIPALLREAYEKGKAEAMGKKQTPEEARKAAIRSKSPTPNSGDGAGKSNVQAKDVSEVASRLGLKNPRQLAILKQLTGKGKGGASISVEG